MAVSAQAIIAVIRARTDAVDDPPELESLGAVHRFSGTWQVDLLPEPMLRQRQMELLEDLKQKGYRVELKKQRAEPAAKNRQ